MFMIHIVLLSMFQLLTWPIFNTKTTFPCIWEFSCEDKIIIEMSYLYNENPYAAKTDIIIVNQGKISSVIYFSWSLSECKPIARSQPEYDAIKCNSIKHDNYEVTALTRLWTPQFDGIADKSGICYEWLCDIWHSLSIIWHTGYTRHTFNPKRIIWIHLVLHNGCYVKSKSLSCKIPLEDPFLYHAIPMVVYLAQLW